MTLEEKIRRDPHVERIQKLGYVGCLHDNVQDMYRDAKSWDPNFIRAVYGEGDGVTKVTVNFGQEDAEVVSETGGRTVLPPWGFLVESPRFIAFQVRFWNGQDYGDGALFTLRPTDGKPLNDSAALRVFHAFGPATLSWRGKAYEVKREETI